MASLSSLPHHRHLSPRTQRRILCPFSLYKKIYVSSCEHGSQEEAHQEEEATRRPCIMAASLLPTGKWLLFYLSIVASGGARVGASWGTLPANRSAMPELPHTSRKGLPSMPCFRPSDSIKSSPAILVPAACGRRLPLFVLMDVRLNPMRRVQTPQALTSRALKQSHGWGLIFPVSQATSHL